MVTVLSICDPIREYPKLSISEMTIAVNTIVLLAHDAKSAIHVRLYMVSIPLELMLDQPEFAEIPESDAGKVSAIWMFVPVYGQ